MSLVVSSGAGGGLLYPDSADRPFNSNTARNNWANNNKADLIKDTTVVNVDGNQWYLYIGATNPAGNVGNAEWMDAAEIVQGEQGIQGVSITTATIDGNGDLILDKSDGTEINAGRAKGDPGGRLPHQDIDPSFADMGPNKVDDWFALGEIHFNFQAPANTFVDSPVNEFYHASGSDTVVINGDQLIDSTRNPAHVIQTVTIEEGERHITYKREGSLTGADLLTNSHWECMTHMLIGIPEFSGKPIPVDQILLGDGFNSNAQGDAVAINNVSPFQGPNFIDSDYTVDVGTRGTIIYNSSQLNAGNIIDINIPNNDPGFFETYQVTIACSSTSASSAMIRLNGSDFDELSPGSAFLVKNFSGSAVPFQISGQRSNTLAGLGDFSDETNEAYAQLVEGKYYAFNVDVSRIGDITSGTYDIFINVFLDATKQERLQTVTLTNSQGDVHSFVRGVGGNNDINSYPFRSLVKNPADGFTLSLDSQIAATDNDDNVTDVLGYTGGGDFSIGPRNGSHNTLIEVATNAYVSYENGDVKRILVEGDAGGGGGLPDNGAVDLLTTSFEDLAPGKWYIDGWENSSGLPDWPSADRIASFINFGGFDGAANGAAYQIFSHRQGIWAAPKSSGVTGPWVKLDTDASQLLVDSSTPLEVQRTGGGVHDAIAVTDEGKLSIGSPSAEISELELVTSQRRISVDRRNDDDTAQVFDQLAFTSDFVAPDPTWLEIDLNQTSGQRFPLRGVNAQTGQEEDATEHDRAYIIYNSNTTEYTYPVELSYVREKGSAEFVDQTFEYTAGQFFVTISQDSTKKLHFTVGSSAKINTSYISQGNENVRFHSLMTGATSIDPGTYELAVSGVKATAADVFTYNWDNNTHQETIQLSMVRDMFNGDYTVPSTSDRLRIVLNGDTYSLVVSSSIGGISGVGFTTGYSGVTPVKNPQVERAEWHRAAEITVNPATLTDIITYQIEPFVTVPATGNRTTTLTFPSEAEFLATFYVPNVNEPQGDKPHIDTFQFKLWMDEVGTDEVSHEVILKSNGDWLPFESTGGDNEVGGIHHVIKKGNHANAIVHHFAFMKHEASAEFGAFKGYTLQTQREDLWYPLSETPSTFDGDTVNTRTVMLNDEGYTVAERRYPVVANVDLGKYQLVRLVDTAENTGGDYDTVTLGTVGQDASGFALASDGADETFADDVILQISSGVYPFETAAAQVEDPIYVSDTGFVTLSTTPYRCGWVVAGDYIVLDIDLYNRSLAASTGGLQPDTDIEVTKVTLKNLANAGEESVLDITDDGDTEFNLSGTTTIRKIDKITRFATDVLAIDGDTGEMTYQGAIIDDKAVVTKEYLEAFGRGIAVPSAVDVSGGNTYQQTTAVARFSTVGTDINDVIIEIDSELLESETIITMPSDSQVTTKNFDVVQVAGQGTSRNVKAGETWRVRMSYDQAGDNTWFWEKVVTGGGGVVYGLAGRNDIIEDPSVKAFAYVEGMPHHLLFETPATADQSAKARLVSNFPASKTFKFTPLAERTYEGVVAATSNEGGEPTLGQYADIPLYCFEPNAVVSRDQVGFINWPSTVQIDVSEGFYVFGTVSGWAGGADRNGTTAVYVGRNADNPKGGGGKIGIALVADRLTILTGNGSVDADNATASQFNKESGVAHFYRYAFYVDRAGNMLYFVQDLNDETTHQGSTTANLASLNNDSRLYVAYDREGANTSTIAVGETTLVMNSEGLGEERWNWRN